MTAGLERLDGHEIADVEILDTGAQCDDLAAELVTEDHRVRHAGQRMRLARVVIGPA
jgi:hypothetical protein